MQECHSSTALLYSSTTSDRTRVEDGAGEASVDPAPAPPALPCAHNERHSANAHADHALCTLHATTHTTHKCERTCRPRTVHIPPNHTHHTHACAHKCVESVDMIAREAQSLPHNLINPPPPPTHTLTDIDIDIDTQITTSKTMRKHGRDHEQGHGTVSIPLDAVRPWSDEGLEPPKRECTGGVLTTELRAGGGQQPAQPLT